VQPAPDTGQRRLLERYVRAWEDADVDGFVSLLRDDAVLSMPPWLQWYRGREAIRTFFAWAVGAAGHGPDPFRLVPAAANRQPAFALYARRGRSSTYRAHAIQVLTFQGQGISSVVNFRDPRLFNAFGLPEVLPDRAKSR
jgi:RNA polymerase sigma-70 factor, ECF subfamily